MIRLQRRGKKHQAAYRLVVGEKRSKLKGEQTEDLGWYDPHTRKFDLDKDRLTYWMGKGAKMSDTVNNILVGAGTVQGKKIPVHKKSKKAASAAAAAPAAEQKA